MVLYRWGKHATPRWGLWFRGGARARFGLGEVMKTWGILRRRVVVATMGALLFGSGGALIALAQINHPIALVSQTRTHGAATATTTSGATTGAAPTSAPTNTTSLAPTSAPPAPRPTATHGAAGQQAQVQGNVGSVSQGANSFTVLVVGSTVTITVNASTAYTGSEKSLSAITPGSNANVVGVWQADGTVLATSIDAQPDK